MLDNLRIVLHPYLDQEIKLGASPLNHCNQEYDTEKSWLLALKVLSQMAQDFRLLSAVRLSYLERDQVALSTNIIYSRGSVDLIDFGQLRLEEDERRAEKANLTLFWMFAFGIVYCLIGRELKARFERLQAFN
ncbi:MAG: hypothetical protein JRI96_17005 [Deltaproteobacteria bacterium]|nr:hypothetical protein [Deltaproteobacteria bacterium]